MNEQEIVYPLTEDAYELAWLEAERDLAVNHWKLWDNDDGYKERMNNYTSPLC